MARTHRSRTVPRHRSGVFAKRRYNKIVRRDNSFKLIGSNYKRLIPWFYDEICEWGGYYEGDFNVKEGHGDWRWEDVDPEDAFDHEVHRWGGKDRVFRKNRNPKSKADKRMINRRKARRARQREKEFFDDE